MSGVICGIAEWIELILCVDVAHLYLTVGPSASFSGFFFSCLFGLCSPVNTIRGDGSWRGAESCGSSGGGAGREAKSRARPSLLMVGDPNF